MRRMIVAFLGLGLQMHAATVRTVCSAGCQYALSQIQQALDDSACGDVIQIQAGQTATTAGGLVLRNKGCSSGPYTSIRTSALDQLAPNQRINPATDGGKLARLTSGTGEVISVEQGAAFYRFEGIEITLLAGQDAFNIVKLFTQLGGSVGDTQVSQLTHHLQFDRCWIHGRVAESNLNFSRCVAANTGQLEITNSVINDCFDANREAQALAGWNASGPFYFRNNQFSGSQIGTLFGGAVPSIGGLRATGLWFLGNYYYRPWAWRVTTGTTDPSGTCLFDSNGGENYNQTASGHWWQCMSGTWMDQGAGTSPVGVFDKNQFELKNAWGAFVEGNRVENGWQPAMLNQHGAAFLFNQVDNSDGNGEAAAIVAWVNVRNNVAKSTPWGTSVGLLGTYDYPMHDIVMESNLFYGLGGEPQSQNDAVGLQSSITGRFRFANNTMLFGRDMLATGGVPVRIDGGPTRYMEFLGNIAEYGGSAVGATGGFYNTFDGSGGLWTATQNAWPYGRTFARNVVVNDKGCTGVSDPSNTFYFRPCPVLNSIGPAAVPDGNGVMACPSCAVPRNIDNGGNDDIGFAGYGSGDYHLASTSRFKNWAELGRDAGADIDKVNWATAHAVDGQFNPYLDFQIETILPDTNSATVLFTAPTTETCTSAVASDWKYAQVVFSNTDLGGDPDRTIAVSGLSPDRRYWLKVVCGAAGYTREEILRTNPNSFATAVVVSPNAVSLFASQTQQFSANVFGSSNGAVTWSISPNTGTITADGLYTAPAQVTSVQSVMITATSVASNSASASVTVTLFPPPTGSAQFVTTDTTTQGNWMGVYGADGHNVIADSVSYPSYATVTATGVTTFIWDNAPTDIRALQRAGGGRIAASWYSTSTFTLDFNLSDSSTHRVALYLLDWDMANRAESITIKDANGALLDSRAVSSFSNGEYLVWNLSGHVKFQITRTAGANAVVSGIFFQ